MQQDLRLNILVQERLVVEDSDPFDTKKQIAAILRSREEEIKLEYATVQVSCKLFMVCFSLAYRCSLITHATVNLPRV